MPGSPRFSKKAVRRRRTKAATSWRAAWPQTLTIPRPLAPRLVKNLSVGVLCAEDAALLDVDAGDVDLQLLWELQEVGPARGGELEAVFPPDAQQDAATRRKVRKRVAAHLVPIRPCKGLARVEPRVCVRARHFIFRRGQGLEASERVESESLQLYSLELLDWSARRPGPIIRLSSQSPE